MLILLVSFTFISNKSSESSTGKGTSCACVGDSESSIQLFDKVITFFSERTEKQAFALLENVDFLKFPFSGKEAIFAK